MVLTATAGAAETVDRAHSNYLLHCAGCHRIDGSGSPDAVPDLRRYIPMFAGSDEGRAFLARAPNASSAPISDTELAEVLNWIVQYMGDDRTRDVFQPYQAEEIGRYRRMPLLDSGAARKALLNNLNAVSETGAGKP